MEGDLKNHLRWCNTCEVPLLRDNCEICGNKGAKICSDLKPMFEDECKILELSTGRQMPGEGWQTGLWMRNKTIWFQGKKLIRVSSNGKPVIAKEYLTPPWGSYSGNNVTSETLHRANQSALRELEEQAVCFVQEIVRMHPKRKPVVSFSGGKDSIVVSYIVRKALQTDEILHIFSNTTIEYPDTTDYIATFKRNNPDIPFYEGTNNHSFLQMCGILGPPSMLNAWCCSVFKARPIAEAVNSVKSKEGVISFEGIRRKS